tara:strand:+ start:975 stop:1733 length:759 start_codon:yes stop_codon:yes gene_type:complete
MICHKLKTIVIFGGTSDIANECLSHWLKEEDLKIILIGRNHFRLKSASDNLKIRHPNSIFECIESDLLEANSIQTIINNLFKSQKIDIALIAHGNLSNQEKCQIDLEYCRNELIVNGLSACLISEAMAYAFIKQGTGSLAVIGSVAGDRGRKSNYTYGAAKGLVDIYIQGLQHMFYKTSISIILIKPGPTESSMTKHLLNDSRGLANISHVAKIIVKGIKNKKQVIYTPRRWAIIMLIIKILPKFIFNKLNI